MFTLGPKFVQCIVWVASIIHQLSLKSEFRKTWFNIRHRVTFHKSRRYILRPNKSEKFSGEEPESFLHLSRPVVSMDRLRLVVPRISYVWRISTGDIMKTAFRHRSSLPEPPQSTNEIFYTHLNPSDQEKGRCRVYSWLSWLRRGFQ